MRISVLLLCVFLSSSVVFSQTAKEENVHSRFRPGIGWYYSGFGPFNTEKLHKYDRLIVDVVYNDWHADRDFFKSPYSSIGVNTAFLFDFVLTKKNTVSIGLGVGYSYYNNTTPLNFIRNFNDKFTTVQEYTTASVPKKVKFAAHYIEIPLEFRFRTKGVQHFKFMIGGKIGYALSAYTKVKNTINGINYKTKEINFPDLNRWRYGATVRIGMRNWAIFGAYYFSSLFKSEKSTQLYPISMGISLSLF